jgi:hypothetical protein
MPAPNFQALALELCQQGIVLQKLRALSNHYLHRSHEIPWNSYNGGKKCDEVDRLNR